MPRPRSRRVELPPPVRIALERVFGQGIDHVELVENSWYARLHAGMRATTRPNRILLNVSREEFLRDPELMLHEYFHVLRQWQPRRLSRTRYVLEAARRGYVANRFEVEAREFVARHRDTFRQLLKELHHERDDGRKGDGPVHT